MPPHPAPLYNGHYQFGFSILRWHNMKLYGDEDILSMELSYEAAGLLTSLRDHFLLLENSISSILFPIVMEKISEGLDDVILNEVIIILVLHHYTV